MLRPNPPGFHTTLTPEIHAQLIEAVPQVIIPTQVAALCRIPKPTLQTWLKKGREDANNGISSVFAQLTLDFYVAQAKVVRETLDFLRKAPKNYQALVWILERCFREDFGAESQEIKELKELFQQILPMLGKGAPINEGKESESGSSSEAQKVHPEGN